MTDKTNTLNVNVTLSLKDGNLNDLALTLVRALNLLIVGPAVEANKQAKTVATTDKKNTVRIPASYLTDLYDSVNKDILIDLDKPVIKAVEKTKVKPVISIMQGNAQFFPHGNTGLELPTMQRRVLGALIRLDNKFPDRFHSEKSILTEAGYPADTRADHMVSLLRRYGFAIESAKTARLVYKLPKNITGYRIRPASDFDLIGLTGSRTPISVAAKKTLGIS